MFHELIIQFDYNVFVMIAFASLIKNNIFFLLFFPEFKFDLFSDEVLLCSNSVFLFSCENFPHLKGIKRKINRKKTLSLELNIMIIEGKSEEKKRKFL